MKKRYDKYRDSGIEWIGEIPDGWEVTKNKYFVSLYEDYSEKGQEELLSVSEYYGIVPRKAIIDEDQEISRAESLVGYKRVKPNTLVINIMLAWKNGLAVGKFEGIVSPAYSVFAFEIGYPWYFHYLFRTSLYNAEFKKHSTGVIESRLRLYNDKFFSLFSHFPPLPVQEKIVKYLDHKTALIDKLISITERKIELLKEKRTALINHAVTKGLDPNVRMKESGIEWIGQIPEHWEVKKLKYVAKIFNGSTPKDNDDYWGDDIVWVTPGDIGKIKNQIVLLDSDRRITQEGLNSCGCTLLPPNSIILTTRAPIGNVIICGTEFTTNQGCKSLVPVNVDYIYLYYVLKTSGVVLENLGQGTTFKELSTFSLNNFYVPHPSVGEQKQIVDFLLIKNEEYEKTISTAQSTINTLKQYRQTLISEVVTGKINVEDEV
ncbi:MAG: restriction endonuclease subunit S [Ignavibacteriaceae bacterium]|nr:restriction endonuclease subunit S [Ignavibacteriaceae bacterium]